MTVRLISDGELSRFDVLRGSGSEAINDGGGGAVYFRKLWLGRLAGGGDPLVEPSPVIDCSRVGHNTPSPNYCWMRSVRLSRKSKS